MLNEEFSKSSDSAPLAPFLISDPGPTPLPAPSPELGGWVDRFDTLDAARWCRSDVSHPLFWAKDGLSGVWDQANVTVENGHLVLKMTAHNLNIFAAELRTREKLGYGIYEAALIAPSLDGAISAMFSYVNDSQTEIDFEFEGRDPRAVHLVTWNSSNTKEHTPYVHSSSFAGSWTKLRYEWLQTGVTFYVNDVLVASHSKIVPSAPAHLIFNVWPVNNVGWGGLSTSGTASMRVDWVKFTPAADPGPVHSIP